MMKTIDYTTHGTCSAPSMWSSTGTPFIRYPSKAAAPETHRASAIWWRMDADEVIRRLKGIPCRGKTTSCPDQLAHALEELKQQG